MKRSIALIAAALSTVPAVAAPALADADPDSHMPSVQTGYCPGGSGMKPIQALAGYNANAYYCDGVPYTDGSHWRYIQFPVPFSMIVNPEQVSFYGLHCVIGDELVRSSLAPPGGCDGAV
jgi:hypothetical protein